MMNVSEITATLKNGLAALKAALADCPEGDYILAWDNGLGVNFTEDRKPYACGVMFACSVGNNEMPEEAWSYTPIVYNGHGEQAKVTLRKIALENAIQEHESILLTFSAE